MRDVDSVLYQILDRINSEVWDTLDNSSNDRSTADKIRQVMSIIESYTAQGILHRPFNIGTHMETFMNYLEVIIHEDGSIHYAVPSHQEYMISYLRNKLTKSRDEIMEMCPREYDFDYMTWLCDTSKCIAVWNDYYRGHANDKQLQSLAMLKSHGLYTGDR